MRVHEAVSAKRSPALEPAEAIVGLVPSNAPLLDAAYGLRRLPCHDDYDALVRSVTANPNTRDVPALKMLPVLFLAPSVQLHGGQTPCDLLTPLLPHVKAAFERQKNCVEFRIDVFTPTALEGRPLGNGPEVDAVRVVARVTMALAERALASAPTPIRLRRITGGGLYLALSLMVQRAQVGTFLAKLGGLRSYVREAGLRLECQGPCPLESFGLSHSLNDPPLPADV